MMNFSRTTKYLMSPSLSRLCLLLHERDAASFLEAFLGRLPACFSCFCCECLPVDGSHLCSITFVARGAKQLTPTIVDSVREPHSRVCDFCSIFTAVHHLPTICIGNLMSGQIWLSESLKVACFEAKFTTRTSVRNLLCYTVTFARSTNANKKEKQHQREDWTVAEWFLIYGLIMVFAFCWRPCSICPVSREWCTPPCSARLQKIKRGGWCLHMQSLRIHSVRWCNLAHAQVCI